MAGVNKAIIVGNLGRDPEARHMDDGTAVSNFSVAVSESWTDKSTGEKREKTEWLRIVAFRRLAEICNQYLTKGSKVYIEGKIQTREWQDKEGNRRWTTEIIARDLQMLGGGTNNQQQGSAPPDAAAGGGAGAAGSTPKIPTNNGGGVGGSGYDPTQAPDDEDIPF